MSYTGWITLSIALVAAAVPSGSLAWDLCYDGSVLPNDPSLGTGTWSVPYGQDPSPCSSDGDILHIPASGMSYYRHAIPFGAPVTLEARFRVTSAIAWRYAWLGAGTPSFMTSAELYTDKAVSYVYGGALTYPADLTLFHTLRIATASTGDSFLWLDGQLIAEGLALPGCQVGISFGSQPAVDSYWDYVAYSADFLPVPEPSSLAALGFAIAGLAMAAARRKRR